MVRVDLPRLAFERITEASAHAGAKRIGFAGSLQWEASTHTVPNSVAEESIRVTCSVAVATVFVYCFYGLAAEADAKRDYAGSVAINQAVKRLLDRIDFALGPAVGNRSGNRRSA
jgi:hypothetical protein